MKNFLMVVITLFSLASFAETFLFEPYVDAQYGCNYIEGLNWRIPVQANTAQEAVELVEPQIGQRLTIGCNRDIYQCVHKNGDVEPRPVEFHTEDRDLLVIGGRILKSQDNQELVQIGAAIYHRNLKTMLKCRW